jgi:MFS family permease
VSAWGVALLGAVLCGACPAILITAPNLSLSGVFFDVFLLALGTSFLVVPLTSILSYLVPGKDSGKAVGLVHTTGYAGSIASTYLGGYLLTVFGTYTWPFGLFAACMVVMVLLLLSLKKAYSAAESMRKRGLTLVEQPTALTQRKAG